MKTLVGQKLIGFGVKPGDIVGVAVSGGVDSMVLLDILCGLREELNIRLVVFHFEHGIRGAASVEDMRFVRRECEIRGVKCVTGSKDVVGLARREGLSIETAARLARYAFLDAQTADVIATAHHAGDLAETVVMNLCRGSGLAGLCGIPERRGRYIRPLLGVSRKDIESYAAAHGIRHVHDSTNDDTAYTRNYVRAEVLPRLEAVNEKALAHIAAAARLLAEDEAALDEAAEHAGGIAADGDGVTVDIDTLFRQPMAIRKRMVRRAVRMCGALTDLSQGHVDDMLALAEKAISGKTLELPGNAAAAVEYGKLRIGKNHKKQYNDSSIVFYGEGRYELDHIAFCCERFCGDMSFQPETEYFDMGALEGACFRHRREGDYIYPLGLGGKKRLSDYLSDRKVPLRQRDGLVVLAKESEVYWVVGIGVSDTTKVKGNARCYAIRFEEI